MKRTSITSTVLTSLCAIIVVLAIVGVIVIQMSPTGQATTSTQQTSTQQTSTQQTSTQQTSTQQTSTQSSTSVSTPSQDGLRLSLSVSPTAIYPGGQVTVSISDFNTLAAANAPTMTGNLTVGRTALTLGPCNQLPLGFGIYEGYYQAGNLSEASPLNIFRPGVYSCPAEFPVAYFSFSPKSDRITLYSSQPSGSGNATVPTSMWTNSDASTQNFSGYWTVQGQGCESSCGVFHQFQPGVYTVLGEDDYGQMAIAHFYVQGPQTASTSTTEQSSTTESGGENVSAASQNGLELLAGINATEVMPGETVQVDLSEFNTLNTVNNVTRGSQWQVRAVLGFCTNMYDQPFGVAVYQGYYTAKNISQGVQLQIFPTVACPMFIRAIMGYSFQPQSDRVVILPGGGVPAPLTGSVVIGEIYGGVSHPAALTPGTYTVVAADEWGALAFLYFHVQ